MSGRRGNSSRATGMDVDMDGEAHNRLEIPTADMTDPVVNAIRFGMKSIMKIANDTVPHCPEDEGKIFNFRMTL